MIYICGRCPWKCRTDDPNDHHTCLNGMKPFFNQVYYAPKGRDRPSP